MKQEFTWRLSGDIPKGLKREAVVATLRIALREWQNVCGVQFIEERDVTLDNDVTFIFGKTSRDYTAERKHEGSHHLIIFSDRKSWCPIKLGFWGWLSRLTQRGEDLLTFALHELGHCLDLEHVSELVDPFSVMLPYPEALGFVNKPSKDDAAYARGMWP